MNEENNQPQGQSQEPQQSQNQPQQSQNQPQESQQLQPSAKSPKPNSNYKKKPASLMCYYAVIWISCIGIVSGLFLGNFCRTVSMEDQMNYIMKNSYSSSSKYSYSSKPLDEPKKNFNVTVMLATWGSFAAVAVGFGLTSVHFRNQEKEIELLESLTNKNEKL